MRLCTWLNKGVFLNWDWFPTALAALASSAEPVVKSFGPCVCSSVRWWHPAAPVPAGVLWCYRDTANIKGKSVWGRSEILLTLHHLLL